MPRFHKQESFSGAKFKMAPNANMKAVGSGSWACYICSLHPTDTKFVLNTGVHIDFEGPLEICDRCCKLIGFEAGLVEPDEADKIKVSLFKAEASRAKAETRAVKAEAALKAAFQTDAE